MYKGADPTVYEAAKTSCYTHNVMSLVDIFYEEQKNSKHMAFRKLRLCLNHVNRSPGDNVTQKKEIKPAKRPHLLLFMILLLVHSGHFKRSKWYKYCWNAESEKYSWLGLKVNPVNMYRLMITKWHDLCLTEPDQYCFGL